MKITKGPFTDRYYGFPPKRKTWYCIYVRELDLREYNEKFSVFGYPEARARLRGIIYEREAMMRSSKRNF